MIRILTFIDIPCKMDINILRNFDMLDAYDRVMEVFVCNIPIQNMCRF